MTLFKNVKTIDKTSFSDYTKDTYRKEESILNLGFLLCEIMAFKIEGREQTQIKKTLDKIKGGKEINDDLKTLILRSTIGIKGKTNVCLSVLKKI